MMSRIQAKLVTSLPLYVILLVLGTRSFLRIAKWEKDVQQVGNGDESIFTRKFEDIDCADIFDVDKQDDDNDEAEDSEMSRLLLEKKRILCIDHQENQDKIPEEIGENMTLLQDGLAVTTLISPPEDADEIIRTAFGNQQYLQLCSSVVFTTTLCITIRYPFPVSPPPADGPNLRHADQRYFNLTGLEMVDDEKLIPYRDLVATDDNVKKSLDDVATNMAATISSSPFGEGEPTVAVAVFTIRKKGQEEFGFFGTRSDEQFHRNNDFFGTNGKVILYGDSKSTGVGSSIGELFHTCVEAPKVIPGLRMACDAEKKNRRRMGFRSFDNIDQSRIFMGFLSIAEGCRLNFTESVLNRANDMKDPNATSLTKLTIIVQHSIAHIIMQPGLLNAFDDSVTHQKDCVNGTLTITSPEAKAALADMGYELNPLVVFDGITQHFPTETGAYTREIAKCKAENGTCDELPGFNIEEHGLLNCRGPVPRSSLYHKFLETERTQFRELGFDMRWYGKTWEFTNLFWWQHYGWGHAGLDCTHGGSGQDWMYKYFFQAMIDDNLE